MDENRGTRHNHIQVVGRLRGEAHVKSPRGYEWRSKSNRS
jgi:hypothetical protein